MTEFNVNDIVVFKYELNNNKYIIKEIQNWCEPIGYVFVINSIEDEPKEIYIDEIYIKHDKTFIRQKKIKQLKNDKLSNAFI
jgi:hypothetical protein